MFLNQRGFGNVEIHNSSTFQSDKIILTHNTTILSNLQVSGLFSCSSILDVAGSDARYVLQSDGSSGLTTGNSIITINNSQDTDGKLSIDTNCELYRYRYVSAFSSFDMRNSDANSSIRFICGDAAVQSNIVGAVKTSTGWTFNTATADL